MLFDLGKIKVIAVECYYGSYLAQAIYHLMAGDVFPYELFESVASD
jgi:hypothetical protein